MRIKGRLLLSYTAMLIIPIVLIAGTGAIFRAYYFGSERSWERRRERIPNPHVNTSTESLVRELNLRTLENPDLLGETSFLRELENRLSSSIKGLAVRKGRDILYSSAALAGSHALADLPDFGAYPSASREPGILRTRVNPLQWDFFFKDGSKGSLFVFWYGIEERFSWGSFIPPLATILILILTNGFLTFIVSRSIMRPLATLKAAAERIKEGDLNSPVGYSARDEFGEVTTAFEQMRTRLKDSIEKQMQYEENRRELVSNISHDLRTPITAIKGYVEGIRDGVAGTPEKMEHYLETIYSRAVMLDRLIDELFLYSRLDLKRVPFNFEKVDLDGFLRRFFQELASDYESLSVDYKTAGMEPMIVIADRVHLRRVLSNLIENSVKYNDKERTSIRVRMEPAGDAVSVSIHDNGPGIEAGALPHIFERYFRGGSKQASNEGSGLGLAIARQIIEAHGGRIWAENDDGTVFHFTLKRALS